MRNKFVTKAISTKLDSQIEEMIKKIYDSFGMELSKINASKIVAWKASRYNFTLTEKKLLQIIGDKY